MSESNEITGGEQSPRASSPTNAKELALSAQMDPELHRLLKTICYMIIIAGAIVALTYVMPLIKLIVITALPFIVGLIFAYIFDPIVTFAQQRLKLSRIGGVTILYALIAAAIVCFVAVVLPILVVQIQSAYQGISGSISEFVEKNEWVKNLFNIPQWKQFGAMVSEWLQQYDIHLDEVVKEAGGQVQNVASTGIRAITGTITGTLGFVYSWVTSIVGAFVFWSFVILVNLYLLLDFSKMKNVMEVMIPGGQQKRIFVVLTKCDEAVGGFIRGMLIVAFLVGLLTFLGLFSLGLKQYALLIGIIAGIGNLVPYLGPISGGVPAMLFVIFSDQYETTQERLFVGLGVLILVIAIQTLEGFVFQPKIVGKNAQLHPLAVLFALAVGANFGILGMIVAVPVACIVRVLVKEFYWDKREEDWKKRTGKKDLADRRDHRYSRAQVPKAEYRKKKTSS